jgi:hypothetical protein
VKLPASQEEEQPMEGGVACRGEGTASGSTALGLSVYVVGMWGSGVGWKGPAAGQQQEGVSACDGCSGGGNHQVGRDWLRDGAAMVQR